MQLQDKAKKSVEQISKMGAALRTHLENPFTYRRESDPQPQPTLPRSASASSQPSLHPSLVRGQVPAAHAEPRRVPKPLPPLPPGASPATSSAFPPEIPSGPNPLSVWDTFNDATDTLQPSNRPKSATVTSTTPSTKPTTTTPPMMVHSSSANLILSSGVPLPSANVFELHPFGIDITPATPAPSISNTATRERPAWFSSESVAVEIPSSASNPFLPPISMKPHNPFENTATSPPLLAPGSDPQPTRPDTHNIFTSFSLDALAPPDNAHTLGSSFGSTSSFGGRAPAPNPPIPSFGGDYFNSGSVIAFSPTSSVSIGGGGGTVPLVSSGGGTVPNYTNSSGGIPPVGSPPTRGNDNFDSFLSARAAPLSPNPTPALPVSPQHPSIPIPVSPSNPGRPSEDEFDSFLTARLSQN